MRNDFRIGNKWIRVDRDGDTVTLKLEDTVVRKLPYASASEAFEVKHGMKYALIEAEKAQETK